MSLADGAGLIVGVALVGYLLVAVLFAERLG